MKLFINIEIRRINILRNNKGKKYRELEIKIDIPCQISVYLSHLCPIVFLLGIKFELYRINVRISKICVDKEHLINHWNDKNTHQDYQPILQIICSSLGACIGNNIQQENIECRI